MQVKETPGETPGGTVSGKTTEAEALSRALEVLPAVVRLLARTVAADGSGERLTLTGFRLLRKLSEGFVLTSELAEQLDVTVATVSAAIDGLVQRGFVERLPRSDDRRIVPLAVTADGRKALAAGRHRQEVVLRDLLSALDSGELQGLALGFGGLRRALAARLGG